MEWPYDEDKLAALILYVAHRLRGDHAGGATKLNKVLFFAEFTHMRRHGSPITGAAYQKLEFGPAPRRLKPVRQSLIDAGLARVEIQYFLGYPQQRLVPTDDVDPIGLSADEVAAVDEVIDNLAGMTGHQVSQLSHLEEGWRMVDFGDTIPFEAAFLRPPVVTDLVRRRAHELAELYAD